MDSGNHFQSVTSKHHAGKAQRMIQWLDDFLMYAKTEEKLLEDIKAFLSVCLEVVFKVNLVKLRFFSKTVKLCGEIILREGVRFDPRNFEALFTMRKHEMGSKLQQLICAAHWMRLSIPNYWSMVQLFHNLLEEAYKRAGKRTENAVEKNRVSNITGYTRTTAFNHIISQPAAATKLSLPKKE